MKKKTCHGFDRISSVGVSDSIVAPLVVDLITDDGVVDVAHVNTDLVSAAGLDLDVEEREFCIPLSQFP